MRELSIYRIELSIEAEQRQTILKTLIKALTAFSGSTCALESLAVHHAYIFFISCTYKYMNLNGNEISYERTANSLVNQLTTETCV